MLAPDLKQNIFVMIYFVILHNFFAIFYGLGIVVSLGIAIYKPKRASILLLIGFIILLFSFEYSKHIADPLYNQTIGSLITLKRYYKFEWFLRVFFLKILPFILPFVGWSLIAFSIYLLKKNKSKK
jgi:hypothetical protein